MTDFLALRKKASRLYNTGFQRAASLRGLQANA